MRRLPPLTAIEAFVAVARLGSVKAAAQELALSAPALSRRVQTLERFLDRPLFDRRHQAMVPNADGERLLAQIAPVLDQLSDAVESMTSAAEVLRLRLGVLPLFASQRLFPRLTELRNAHPEIHLDIDTAAHGVTRLGEGLDAVIALARDIDPALYARRLDRNMVYVIGSRSLIERPDPIVRPQQLATLTALVHREMPDTFTAWRTAAGLHDIEPAAVDHFDSGALMLEAAAQGLGVAFMHESHFQDAADPRLVRLFEIEVVSPYSYWFVCRPRALQMKQVRLFRDWLIGALGSETV
ncbi:LysR substrate-binding domain-containing protein [Sphingomonas jeddahensis]|uniref:Glycine cleavage system transcriptional activator n=1 Tax=Sphingomonas jeddahensis TaxID=1915074 RepID=A0A1V2ERX9_9SPHN|nr:LysR substrate-binding domain-containing protein [Sphingomonas jeddahensis]ONF95257.1 Glycine cleavage system transcriptional activator [Sphingomonas jeddahensis]